MSDVEAERRGLQHEDGHEDSSSPTATTPTSNGQQQLSEKEIKATRPPTSPLSRALWSFSSQWFLIPQGTGITAVILHNLDYQFRGLTIISVIVWIYTIVLLVGFVFLYLLRAFVYPRHVARVLRTSLVETSCLASISISFTTIIQMMALVLTSHWGPGWGKAAYVLWWINTAMAVAAVIGIPYVYVKLQPPGVKAITPAVLLPLISALTSAAGGGVVCNFGAISDRLQVPTIIVSYLEVGAGIPLAMAFNDIFMTRLFDKSFPKLHFVYQDMILCGPFGQGSFALQVLGQAVAKSSFAKYDRGTFLTAEAARPIAFASQFLGLLAWGYGTFWWCFAVISITHTILAQPGGWRKTEFTMAAWSLVFPWGVYTNAAVQFGKLMKSPAWSVWSTALLIMQVIIWILNQVCTVKGLISGKVLGLDRGWKKNAYLNAHDDKEV